MESNYCKNVHSLCLSIGRQTSFNTCGCILSLMCCYSHSPKVLQRYCTWTFPISETHTQWLMVRSSRSTIVHTHTQHSSSNSICLFSNLSDRGKLWDNVFKACRYYCAKQNRINYACMCLRAGKLKTCLRDGGPSTEQVINIFWN